MFFVFLLAAVYLMNGYNGDDTFIEKTFPPHCRTETIHAQNGWSCERKDGYQYITFDCNLYYANFPSSLLNDNNNISISVWSVIFPSEMKELTIQNCIHLSVQIIRYGRDQGAREPSELEKIIIKNAESVTFTRTNDFDRNQGLYNQDMTFRIPLALQVENVRKIIQWPDLIRKKDTYTPMYQHSRPRNGDDNQQKKLHIKLINTTLDTLGKWDLWNLKEFVLDKVTVLQGGTTEEQTISSKFTSGYMQFTNCSFLKSLRTNFLDVVLDKVIFKGNIFYEDFGTIKVTSKEFSLVGNQFKGSLEKMDITSPHIQILNNTFTFLSENAFYVSTGLGKKQLQSSSLLISGNRIQMLDMQSLSSKPPLKPPHQEEKKFNILSINNNQINCSCRNVEWFQYMADRDGFPPHQRNYYRKYFKETNNNTCMEPASCNLGQLPLEDFDEWCNARSPCEKSSSGVKFDKNVSGDPNTYHLLKELVRVQVKTSETIDGMLKGIENLGTIMKSMEKNLIEGKDNSSTSIETKTNDLNRETSQQGIITPKEEVKEASSQNIDMVLEMLKEIKDDVNERKNYQAEKNVSQDMIKNVDMKGGDTYDFKSLDAVLKKLNDEILEMKEEKKKGESIEKANNFKQELNANKLEGGKSEGLSVTNKLIPDWFLICLLLGVIGAAGTFVARKFGWSICFRLSNVRQHRSRNGLHLAESAATSHVDIRDN